MTFELIDLGASRSLPEEDPLRSGSCAGADIVLIVGGDPAAVARALSALDTRARARRAILVELGTECLGFHTGEGTVTGESNVLGFARFRLGTQPASRLVELVRQRSTSEVAVAAATAVFQVGGLEVSICNDVPGRIVDSLLRPYLNAALKSVDEGLAAPADLDRAVCLGLGYPRGPIELLEESSIEAHHQVSMALYEALGASEFFPAPRARIAAMRLKANLGKDANHEI